jgi:hypothetical protein
MINRRNLLKAISALGMGAPHVSRVSAQEGTSKRMRGRGSKKIKQDFWDFMKWEKTRFFDFGARFLFGGRHSFVDIVDGNGGAPAP